MSLQIVGIEDRGVAGQERLTLTVAAECSLTFFAVLATNYAGPTGINRRAKGFYWFPPRPVKAGDTLVLYSGVGVDSQSNTAAGGTLHIFFWGRSEPLWSKTGECAVLVEFRNWKTTPLE